MATPRTKSQSFGSAAGAALTLLGFASVAGWMDQFACPFGCLFGIPVRIALEALAALCHLTWPSLQPCALAHVLGGFLKVTASGWQLVMTLAGVA